jgi:hypothetical protein
MHNAQASIAIGGNSMKNANHTRRNPNLPRILLAGTDSVLTLDELRSPRYIVISPGRRTIIVRLPLDIPLH